MRYRQQKYSCCQLVSAINARIFLGGPDVTDAEYEELADLTNCRQGAPERLARAWEWLGLALKEGPCRTMDLRWARRHLPVEFVYLDPERGLHSALVVGVSGASVRLVNASWSLKRWLELDFPSSINNRTFRSFTLATATDA